MLRITHVTNSAGHDFIRLEGRLLEPWVAELQAITSALQPHADLALDLTEVQYIDTAGQLFLKEFLARGGRICRCSPFVAELLK